MSVIFCDVNLGSLNQTIYLEQNGVVAPIANIPTVHLGEALTGLAYGLDAYNIKLSGPEGYLAKAIEEVKETESMSYGLDKINIEVMN